MGDRIIIFWIVLMGAVYHLLRDILQIVGVNNIFTNIGHWSHQWCGTYCNYVTLPVDGLLIITSAIIISRRKTGALGILVLLTLIIGLFMWFWK